MVQNKFYCFFVCFFVFTGNIFSSMPPYPRNLAAFNEFLKNNPNVVATKERPADSHTRYGTVAHQSVYEQNLDQLMALFNAGETAAQPLEQNLNTERKLIGSTAFLGLCFAFKNFFNEDSQKALTLLSLFAQRTPEVVMMTRNDKMTPAMAIACSKSVQTFDALKILLQHNPHAFEGNAKRNSRLYTHDYPRTVPFLLIASAQQNLASKEALNLVLTTLKNHNVHNVKNQLSDLINFAYQIYKHNFADFLQRWSNQNLQNRLEPIPVVVSDSCIAPNGDCLCCMNKCLCCQKPTSLNHTNFWLQFYKEYPQHQDAEPWMKQYEEYVATIW